jgi:hypothetical protein
MKYKPCVLMASFVLGACLLSGQGSEPFHFRSTSVGQAQPDKEIDRLAKAYRAAQTESERRAVCLEAIDKGVVARGRSVAIVDAIFGTDYAKQLPHAKELHPGIVYFYKTDPLSNRDDVLVPFIGWYFAFNYDSAGRLENYHLTNLHKK